MLQSQSARINGGLWNEFSIIYWDVFTIQKFANEGVGHSAELGRDVAIVVWKSNISTVPVLDIVIESYTYKKSHYFFVNHKPGKYTHSDYV